MPRKAELNLVGYLGAVYQLTGRLLGNSSFVRNLKVITGVDLTIKKPGRKPLVRKLLYCSLNFTTANGTLNLSFTA